MRTVLKVVVVLALVVLVAQVGVFFLYAATSCQLPSPSISPADAEKVDELRVLVLSDIHILGKRRRSWLERAWIDWQVRMTALSAFQVHRPELVLVLGDQLDEGGLPTPQRDWEEYVARFKHVTSSLRSLKTLYLVGNHDTSFGRYMETLEIARFERAFGPSNFVEYVGDHAFIGVNTMALDSDVTRADVKAQAEDFLASIDTEQLRASTAHGSVVLLTHLPLHRPDDMRCGDHRARESGHVTYEHPSFQYAAHHHVLSEALSARLLSTIAPDVVLSGHTHAWCEFAGHSDGVREFTVPALSWGQRPDPSYALLGLRSRRAASEHAAVDGAMSAAVRCSVPNEHGVFALYALTVMGLVLARLCRGWCLPAHHRTSKGTWTKTQ
ncbi:hypothetical protein PybrP1_005329 [[Pythium] brassicae (nom. inval.)]|nr:hypothetical protein PybrP1_005329 [[Pythium] brassicae (nom. inval.)]